MRKLTELCTVTLAAVAFAAAPAAAHETDPWSAPTTPPGAGTDRDKCPPAAEENDDADSGTPASQGGLSVSPAAAGDTGSAGPLGVPTACGALTAARVGPVPEGGVVAGEGRGIGSGNAAVLFVAAVGALAVTGSAVVAHRRNTHTH